MESRSDSGESRWRRQLRNRRRHWTKQKVQRHLRLLLARSGSWPTPAEYAHIAARGTLPPLEEVLTIYGSWSSAHAAIAALQRVPEVRELHRRYSQGVPTNSLARELGVSDRVILYAFREAGLPVRRGGRYRVP